MDYQEARKLIRTGDQAFYTHTGIGGKIISFFTKSRLTHVGTFFRFNDRLFIVEAVVPRVRMVLGSYDPNFTWVALGLNPPKEIEDTFFKVLEGGKYSWGECITGYLGFNKDNDRWQCSELSKYWCRLNSMNLRPGATPAAFYNELIEAGYPSVKVESV